MKKKKLLNKYVDLLDEYTIVSKNSDERWEQFVEQSKTNKNTEGALRETIHLLVLRLDAIFPDNENPVCEHKDEWVMLNYYSHKKFCGACGKLLEEPHWD